MDDLQEDDLDSTGRTVVKTHEDLFIVRDRMAADRARAATERLARVAATTRRGSGLRVWLGHRLVAVGTFVAGDRPSGHPTVTPGRPS